MDDITAKRIHKLALAYALSKRWKKGNLGDPNDFAQYCVLYALEHEGNVGKFYYRMTDFLRYQYGRIPLKESVYTSKMQIAKNEATQHYAHVWMGDKQEALKRGTNLDFLSNAIYMPKIFLTIQLGYRMAYYLYHKYEFTQEEIADIMGLTYSRVNQILKDVQKQIKLNLK